MHLSLPRGGVAMVPDVPQLTVAFGEPPSGCLREVPSWRPEQTSLLQEMTSSACWARLRPEPAAAQPPPHTTSLYPGSSPHTTSLYPGRAMSCVMPLSSNRVSSSSDSAPALTPAKDFSQPLFVDTTVEYDLPKEAYPPENSEPLLIVHPQYFEHLRHRRTLGATCSCQLCNFYGRRIPLGGQDAAAAAASAVQTASQPASSAAAATSSQTFLRPMEAPRHWPRYQQQQQVMPNLQQQQQQQMTRQSQQQQQLVPMPHHRMLTAQQQQQQQHHLLMAQQHQMMQASHQHQQQQRQHQQQQQMPVTAVSTAVPARYNCMLERYRDPSVTLPAFVTPSVSCDSDSGYSSVELEAPEWCSQLRRQQADGDAVRDVLLKRKRRTEPQPQPVPAMESAAKRRRVCSFWPGGMPGMKVMPGMEMMPCLSRQPAVV